MLGGVGPLQTPAPLNPLPIIPNNNDPRQASPWNPNTNNGVNFKNGFLGFQTQSSQAANKRSTFPQQANNGQRTWTGQSTQQTNGKTNNRNELLGLATNSNQLLGQLERYRSTNQQNIVNQNQYYQDNSKERQNQSGNYQQQSGNNVKQSGNNQPISGQYQQQNGNYQKQNSPQQQQPIVSRPSLFEYNSPQIFQQPITNTKPALTEQRNSWNSWLSPSDDNKNATSHSMAGFQPWRFNNNAPNAQGTSNARDQTNGMNGNQDNKEGTDSLSDKIEKLQEDFEEKMEAYQDQKEQEKKDKKKLEQIRRYALLLVPFFIFDKPTAAYFVATELFSVYLDDLGFDDELNTIVLLFVQCVDVRALSRGRFKFVEGYQTNWYQELYDYSLTKAGIDDRIRLGSQMFMPQSPMPTYEDKKRRKKRHVADLQDPMDFRKQYKLLIRSLIQSTLQ